MFDQTRQERMIVPFTGAGTGIAPLTWGQKAILQDMQESGNQFNMGGAISLPEGSTLWGSITRSA
jgi:hypothetical protein